jgi:hypothetical protein
MLILDGAGLQIPPNGQGVIYFGGSQQYEIIQTRDMYWRDGGWKDFIKEVNRNVLK